MGKVGFFPCDFKELGVAKRPLSTTSLRDQRATALEHHSANQFLKAATNLILSSRNCFKLSSR